MQFTPIEDFYSEEMKSHYTKGLSYTARDPHDPALAAPSDPALPDLHLLARTNRAKLAALLPQWLEEKKVALGVPGAGFTSASPSGMAGEGKVE